METRERSADFIPLADMHTDGVRFDPDRLAAWKKGERADQKETHLNQDS